MPIEHCASGCGRKISISAIEGGNPEALRHPEEWAIEFFVCLDCRAFVCDRCAKETCPDCGGKLVEGDSMAEAQRRLAAAGGQIEGYVDKDSIEAYNKQVAEVRDHILGIDIEQVEQVAEPGALDALKEATVSFASRLQDYASSLSVQVSDQTATQLVYEQLARAYMTGGLVGLIAEYKPLGLEEDEIGYWYNLDLFTHQRAMTGAEQDDEQGYKGVLSEQFDSLPFLDEALSCCALETLGALGIEQEATSQDFRNFLLSVNTTGLRLACAQYLAVHGRVLLADPKANFDETYFLRLFRYAWALDSSAEELVSFDWLCTMLEAVLKAQLHGHSTWALAAMMKLGVTFEIDELVGFMTDTERATLFMVVGKLKDAHKMYERAALAGDPQAQYAVGILYEIGIGCEKSKEKYEHWMKTSAETGYPAALGECYGDGLGVPKDEKKSIKQLKKGAKAGDTFAMGSVGGYYLEQDPPDKKKAVKWLTMAAEGGNVLAAWMLKQLEDFESD